MSRRDQRVRYALDSRGVERLGRGTSRRSCEVSVIEHGPDCNPSYGILLLIDKIAFSGRRDFIPLLRVWAEIDYKNVRSRIAGIIRALEGG